MTDYPFDPSAWLSGTRGLNAAQSGVYITLVAKMYEKRAPVPVDSPDLARYCGSRVSDFKVIIAALISAGKIVIRDGGYWNDKVEVVLAGVDAKSKKLAANAAQRWNTENKAKTSPTKNSTLQSADSHSPKKRSKINGTPVQLQATASQLHLPDLSPDKESSPQTPFKENTPIPPSRPSDALGRAPAQAREPRRPTNLSLRDRQAWDVLKTVLSPDLVVAVLDHRKAIRQPLTERAAQNLAKHFEDARDVCGLTPDEAADVMISRGWRGFEPEWVLNDRHRRVPPNPAARSPPTGAAPASAAPSMSDEIDDYIAKLKAKEAGKNG